MTTNTYQALCDRVGLKPEIVPLCDVCEKQAFELKDDDTYICLNADEKICLGYEKIYPPATAEQRERLEELVFKANYGLFMNDTQGGWQYFYESRKFKGDYVVSKDRTELTYALTQKLVDEGVLSKEEVKEVLCGK